MQANPTTSTDAFDVAPRRRRTSDGGSSLVEIVIAIALMGVTVTTVVGSLRLSVQESRTDKDRATAAVWLQAASDEIYAAARVQCTPDGSGRVAAISAYADAARRATVPPAWARSDGSALGVAAVGVTDVEYLGRNSPDDDFEWAPDVCFEGGVFDDSPLFTQRVTLLVVHPDGESSATLQMVKSE